MDNSPGYEALVAPKERSPSETVVLAVAEAADLDPTDLHSLHDVVDPDALDAIFRHRSSGSVTFEYQGYTVTVEGTDEVVVREAPPGKSP